MLSRFVSWVLFFLFLFFISSSSSSKESNLKKKREKWWASWCCLPLYIIFDLNQTWNGAGNPKMKKSNQNTKKKTKEIWYNECPTSFLLVLMLISIYLEKICLRHWIVAAIREVYIGLSSVSPSSLSEKNKKKEKDPSRLIDFQIQSDKWWRQASQNLPKQHPKQDGK